MMELIDSILSIFSGSDLDGTRTCLVDLDTLTQILIVIGALNWGSIALCPSKGDLVTTLSAELGGDRAFELERLIKGLVGVAGVYQLFNLLLPFLPAGTTIINPCIIASN